MPIYSRNTEFRTTGLCYVLLLLLVLIQPRFSWANLSSSSATISALSWNPSIRIGVQSKRNSRPTVLASIPTRQYYQPQLQQQTATSVWGEETDFSCDDNELQKTQSVESTYASSHVNELQPSLEEKATYASSVPRNAIEQSRGFRSSCNIPFWREPKEGYYRNSATIPCAAVAVSSKTAPTFTSNFPYSKDSAPRKSLNTRKDASYPRKSTSTANSPGRALVFWENMICGAISRSMAQTVMHPANVCKTMLQQSDSPAISSLLAPQNIPNLMRGAGANLVLSIPHGAVNFAVLEMVRKELSRAVNTIPFLKERERKIGPALDFASSAISTICCSVVSTPQMMIVDNIMCGNYPNLPAAVKGLAAQGTGLSGFYARGWWPGLAGKIPSYALTWTFFQKLKDTQKRLTGRDATNTENSIMGCLASGTTVCLMIPMDTIKTRLVTQASRAATTGAVPYKGIIDCAVRVAREEGIKSFYRGLPPRLISVVPMIGIQFGVYEFMKKVMQRRALAEKPPSSENGKPGMFQKPEDKVFDPYTALEILEEAAMEVAASPEDPMPAPRILKRLPLKDKNGNKRFFNFNFGTRKGSALMPATP